MSDLLSLEDLAEIIGIPVTTLRYWRFQGTGPKSFKLGKHIKYDRAEVERWIQAQREKETARKPVST